MCMRRISRELAADDDSHVELSFFSQHRHFQVCLGHVSLSYISKSVQEYRVSKVKASSLHLDESLRVRDEWETSRPQRKNSLVTLANVAMIAAAAGIATALCREIKVKII